MSRKGRIICRHECMYLLPLHSILFFILCLHINLQNRRPFINLFSDHLLNSQKWLAWVGLWGAYIWKTLSRSYIPNRSHKYIVNPIHMGSTSIIFWMGWSVLFMFHTHVSVLCFLKKKSNSKIQVKNLKKRSNLL